MTKDMGQRTQTEASLYCSEDNGRLLSINSCQEFEGLNYDLWSRDQDAAQSYWVGFYAAGLDNYNGQQRTSIPKLSSINSYGQLAVISGGNKDCADNTKIVMGSFSTSSQVCVQRVYSVYSVYSTSSQAGHFGQLVYTSDKNLKMELTEFSDADTPADTFMCERDHDWTCPQVCVQTVYRECTECTMCTLSPGLHPLPGELLQVLSGADLGHSWRPPLLSVRGEVCRYLNYFKYLKYFLGGEGGSTTH